MDSCPHFKTENVLGSRPFPIMLLNWHFMLLEIPLYAKTNAQIMLDSQTNTTLVAENALFNLKQNVETQASCVLATEQSEKCSIFCYKTSDTVKTCPKINS